uniref:Uncharacterized protein n=1 Tax=Homalodisca liturata TaxID=320908 RepID=A0A1B6JYP5_9HEMI
MECVNDEDYPWLDWTNSLDNRWRGYLPLHFGIGIMDVDAITNLVARGADVNEPSIIGNTALHISVKRDCASSITKFLIANNGNIESKNKYGLTPLHEAVRYFSLPNTRILLRHNANVKVEDEMGQTALDWAVHNLRRETLEEAPHLLVIARKIIEELLDWGTPHCPQLLLRAYPWYDSYTVEHAVTILSKHSLKRKCARLPYHSELLISERDLQRYKSKCLNELTRLKSVRVNSHSLYCIFSTCCTVYHVEDVKRIVWSSNILVDFPIYGSLLQATFTKNEKREELLSYGEQILSYLFLKIELYMPLLVVGKILDCINNEDLPATVTSLCKIINTPLPNLKYNIYTV